MSTHGEKNSDDAPPKTPRSSIASPAHGGKNALAFGLILV